VYVCVHKKKHGSSNFDCGHNILWILMGQNAGSMFDRHKVMFSKLFWSSSVHIRTVFEGYAKTSLQNTHLPKYDAFLVPNERIDGEKNSRFVFSASILTRGEVACTHKGHGSEKNLPCYTSTTQFHTFFLCQFLCFCIYIHTLFVHTVYVVSTCLSWDVSGYFRRSQMVLKEGPVVQHKFAGTQGKF
jgi:hypothetical protein